MSVIPIMDGIQRPESPGTTETAHEVLLPRFTAAADILAGKAQMTDSAAEAKDFADAALKCVTAIITLDPDRLAGGDTPHGRKAAMPDRPTAETGKPATRDTDRDGRIGEH
jgi:hypothetical protein